MVGDRERLLPRVKEEAAQPELVERALELVTRVVPEQRVDPRETREPPASGRDRLRDGVVRRSEVVARRLGRADDRAFDARPIERRENVRRARRAAEDRVADEGETVDDHWTASRMRRALSANTSRSSAGSSPASRTFSTSIRGEHAGPSLA